MSPKIARFPAKTFLGPTAIVWGLSALWLLSCASAELEVPPTHPGHPQASSGRVARTEALTPAYALDSGAPRTAPADENAHHHHHGHAAPAADEAPRGTREPVAATFTCPMHPEVVRAQPGKCPLCGMDLVPKKDAK